MCYGIDDNLDLLMFEAIFHQRSSLNLEKAVYFYDDFAISKHRLASPVRVKLRKVFILKITVSFTNLDQDSEMIILESILTTFEASCIFLRNQLMK